MTHDDRLIIRTTGAVAIAVGALGLTGVTGYQADRATAPKVAAPTITRTVTPAPKVVTRTRTITRTITVPGDPGVPCIEQGGDVTIAAGAARAGRSGA